MKPSKVLQDIVTSATGAKCHYDVWWALVSEAKPKYIKLINNHSDFFRASQDAHYTAFFIYLAHLFDKRSDSSSMSKYLELIKDKTDSERFQELETSYCALFDRVNPLLKVRHKCIAHVDVKLSENDIFEEVNLTWNEVRRIISDVANFVELLSGAPHQGATGIPRDGRLSEATMHLLETLVKNG
ncbi:MAG: hypothetical protein Q8R74_11615 [Methylophilus sp.]|nr:hypothetical protein [Methylophilus sp.]